MHALESTEVHIELIGWSIHHSTDRTGRYGNSDNVLLLASELGFVASFDSQDMDDRDDSSYVDLKCIVIGEDTNRRHHPTATTRLYGTRDGAQVIVRNPVILVPFGNGESGKRAGMYVVEMAEMITKRNAAGRPYLPELVFYHTTWRDPNLEGDCAADHMAQGARELRDALVALAVNAGVPHRVVVEMASDVAGGISRAALRQCAGLIVMTRGLQTRSGSYVDQVLARTTVPTLVVGILPNLLETA